MVSGQRSALAIKIFGQNLSDLRRVADKVKAAAETVPGIVDLGVEQVVDIPQLVIRVDAQAASNYGFSRGAAADAIGTALWGRTVGNIFEQGIATDIVVRYDKDVARDLESVRRLRIPTPTGALVPVSAVAEVTRDLGPNYILRENVSRRLVVTANIASSDLRGTVAEVKRRVDAAGALPKDVYIEYAGQFEREEATTRRLLILGALTILAIGFIVTSTVRSFRRGLIVLINMPLALAGGIAGVYLAGGVLSVATTIGFITLFGIATRNGILLATRTRDLELAGTPTRVAVELAAQERLAPILMTAVTAALGLLPLALALGQPGSEIQAPMAIVILTGLTTSTILNMLVVPALLARWGTPRG